MLAYNTIPGEIVTVEPFKRTKEGVRARLMSVEVASPDRITPKCPYAGTCGGCKWQHVKYETQLKAKFDGIARAFTEASVPLHFNHVTAAQDLFYYRNRMDFVFGRNGELGLKLPDRWWATLDINTCFLQSPESAEIVNRVREWSKATGLPFWDSKKHEGFFRYLVVREGKRTGERLVMLVTSDDPSEKTKEIVSSLVSVIDDRATSIMWGINPRLTDLSIADVIIPLKGEPFFHEEIGGIRYRINPNSFFQTNTEMAAKLQEKVIELCGDLSGKTLLDLYCGSGFFSLPMSRSAQRTIGIELDEAGIAAAKQNAALNTLENLEYFASKAETFDWTGYAPDVVILDPPRAGMHPDVIEALLKALPPTLVYVSCNYHRLVTELPALLKHYDLVAGAALDLFPHTPHVEVVVKLVRR